MVTSCLVCPKLSQFSGHVLGKPGPAGHSGSRSRLWAGPSCPLRHSPLLGNPRTCWPPSCDSGYSTLEVLYNWVELSSVARSQLFAQTMADARGLMRPQWHLLRESPAQPNLVEESGNLGADASRATESPLQRLPLIPSLQAKKDPWARKEALAKDSKVLLRKGNHGTSTWMWALSTHGWTLSCTSPWRPDSVCGFHDVSLGGFPAMTGGEVGWELT